MSDAQDRASRTQALVIDALRDRHATPEQIVDRILSFDDRNYDRRAIRAAINALLGRGQIEVCGSRLALVRDRDRQ